MDVPRATDDMHPACARLRTESNHIIPLFMESYILTMTVAYGIVPVDRQTTVDEKEKNCRGGVILRHLGVQCLCSMTLNQSHTHKSRDKTETILCFQHLPSP
jgi:hypothetical protein